VKIVADVAEALIGAAYLSTSRSLEGALQAIHDLRIPFKNLKTWADVKQIKGSDSGASVVRSTSGRKRKQPETEATSVDAGESWMKAFKPPPTKYFGYEFKDEQRVKDILVSCMSPLRGSSAYTGFDGGPQAEIGCAEISAIWRCCAGISSVSRSIMAGSCTYM